MTIQIASHRYLTFILLLFLANAAYAQEQSAATDEPAVSAESSESTQTTESPAAADAAATEPATQEQEAPRSDTTEVKGEIARAQFTTAIADREPTDDIVMLTNNNDKIYFFTELVNFDGQSIKHRWEYEGKEMAEVEFKVEGPRWRVHSSKTIKPEWTGIWNVIVLDQDNNPVKVSSFEVVEASTATQSTTPSP